MGLVNKVRELARYTAISLVPTAVQGVYSSLRPQDAENVSQKLAKGTEILSPELTDILDPYIGPGSQLPEYLLTAGIMAGIWKVTGDNGNAPVYRKGLKRTLIYWGLIAAGATVCHYANKMAGSQQSTSIIESIGHQIEIVVNNLVDGKLPQAISVVPLLSFLSIFNSFHI